VEIAGVGNYCRLTPGYKFTLAEHFDADGDYIITSVEHDVRCVLADSGATADFEYSNTFKCIPAAIPFRPARETPRPTVKGTQTAVVIGDKDDEIDPDKYGRVKVVFRWDPEGPRGLDSSCWVRVAQFWAGRQWGAQFIPRVGDEVVVAFLEGDPDKPLIIGSVYNADNMPLYELPKNKTQSGIKSHSSPGGNSQNFNELRFEDKKGQEQIIVHAEKDMNTTVEDNHTVAIGGGEKSKDPKKTGTSTNTTFGDTKHTITKGDYNFGVSAGKADYFVKGPVAETFDTSQTTVVTGAIDISSKTSTISLTAPQKIVLTVGGSQLTITPDSITLSAQNIILSAGSTLTASAPSVGIDGKSDATYQGGTVDVTGRKVVTAGVGGQTVVCDASQVAVSGAAIKASASGTHEITGALVKIN
jgi:type VI secretion system secreted protein VgrG